MSVESPVVAVLTAGAHDRPPGLDSLHQDAEVRYAYDQESLQAGLPGADVLLVTDFRSNALAKAWPAADKLAWLHAASAGVDAVLTDEVEASKVTVTNARGIFDGAIAETVLGAILLFAKDTRTNIELQQRREWRHRDTQRIAAKRVLVVGAGSIGGAIARLCTAAGMRVTGLARSAREDDDFEAVHAIDDLHAHLGQADYVVIAAPLNRGTRQLFDAAAFAAMPRHAVLINIGRGPIVNTDALLEALDTGAIAGAALDVFEQEPLPAEHPLWDYPNVLISAHMAGDFIGWREALSAQFLDNFARWRAGEPLHNIVKKPA